MRKPGFLIFIVVAFITAIMLNTFFETRTIKWDNINIHFVAPDQEGFCKDVNSIHAEGLFIKFGYKAYYKFPFGVFNGLVLSEELNKKNISSFTIKVICKDGIFYDLGSKLSNYIERELLFNYLKGVYLNMLREGEYLNNIEVHDENIQRIEKYVDQSENIKELSAALKKDEFNLSRRLSGFMDSISNLTLMPNNLDEIISNEGVIFCPNVSDEICPVSESYIGSISFFVWLYNNDHITVTARDLYPGVLFKLAIPEEINKKSVESLETEIILEDGTSIKNITNLKNEAD